MSVSGSESDGTLPRKRARGDDGLDMNGQNHGHGGGGVLPPLSPSLLGVEPLDELVREVADFVHGKIGMRAHDLGDAKIEVEGRVGVIRERGGGGRIGMPVVCETGTL
jgi:polynucleotide 5'-triphosphatase